MAGFRKRLPCRLPARSRAGKNRLRLSRNGTTPTRQIASSHQSGLVLCSLYRCEMPGGKCFRLHTATLAVASSDGHRVAVTILTGEVVKVVANTNYNEGMVDVLWDGQTLSMFFVDLESRGEELPEVSGVRT